MILDELEDLVTALKGLTKAGWLKRAGSLIDLIYQLKNGKLAGEIRAYQTHFGIDGRGELTPETIQHLVQPRFCGRPDRELVQMSKLTALPEVRWFAQNPGDMPGLTGDEFLQALDDCWEYLPTVCGVTARNVRTEEEANNLIQCGNIDGTMGTLAWSELWNGSAGVLHQMYDNGDRWKRASGTIAPSNELDVFRVIVHESCHLLGLPHDTEDMNCLMAPTYSLSIDRCTQRDIDRLQKIYGPPKSITKPVNPGTDAKPVVPTKSYTVQATVTESADGMEISWSKVSMKFNDN